MSLSFPIQPLLTWYQANRKSFPWRKEPTPYRVWISEIMLQQTRIEAALPYYTRFLEAFPDVRALADADEDVLLKHWQGLGYYSRAKNLKKAAQLLCEKHDGRLPESIKELRALPGIGDYTAGAIASIAMGLPEPAVDGNVLRVIMRFTACSDDVMQTATRVRVAAELRKLYPSGKDAGELTQALMELGETVCLPGTPHCEKCPICAQCAALAQSLTDSLPVRAAPKPRREEKRTILITTHGGRYALHRRDSGVLRGMWEPLCLEEHRTPEVLERFFAAHSAHILRIEPLKKARHLFSHIEWDMCGYLIECDTHFDDPEYPLVWATPEQIGKRYAIPSAFRAFWDEILP